MITLDEAQLWVKNFDIERKWDKCPPFELMNYLTEETGEVARAVRTIEVGRNRPDEPDIDENAMEKLIEEIGDVIGSLAGVANYFNISFSTAFSFHQKKMEERYSVFKE